MSHMPSLEALRLRTKLNNGLEMPTIGLGTYLSKPSEVGDAVRTALKAGYRAIDTANEYGNEKEIGDALEEVFNDRSLGIKRGDVFITTKCALSGLDDPRKYIEESIANLRCQYIDLYLVHLPLPVEKNAGRFVGGENWKPKRMKMFGMQDTWRILERAVHDGLVRSLGVSNFACQMLNDLLNYAVVPPVVNEIELHPYLQQRKFVKYMLDNNVQAIAFAPLGSPGFGGGTLDKSLKQLMDNEVIKQIAAKHGRMPAQVLVRWQVQNGHIVIPKSVQAENIIQNADVDFVLDKEDMARIGDLECGERQYNMEWFGMPVFE